MSRFSTGSDWIKPQMNTDEHRSVFICVHPWFRFRLRFYCAVKFVANNNK